MNDDVQNIAQMAHIKVDQHAVDFWLNLIGVSTLAGSCSAILSDDMRNLKGVVRCAILATLAGYIVGSFCEGYGVNDSMTHGLVGLSGFLANYIFIFILKLAKMAIENPKVVLDWILGWIPTKKAKE